MNKESKIKFENFLVASIAASACFFVSFLRSWTVPITSVRRAHDEHKQNGTPFLDAYANAYDKSIIKLSQKPLATYQKYQDKIAMLRAKYNGKNR